MNATTYGPDVAKRVFQLYWVDAETGEIVNRRFGRDDLITFLAQRPAGRAALEACGSARLVGHVNSGVGTRGRVVACAVYPALCANEQDRRGGYEGDRDCGSAPWNAHRCREDGGRASDAEPAPSRSQLIKFRTMQVNQLRGFCTNRVTFRTGRAAGLPKKGSAWRNWKMYFQHRSCLTCKTSCDASMRSRMISLLEKRIGAWQKQEGACRATSDVPGIGRRTATALEQQSETRGPSGQDVNRCVPRSCSAAKWYGRQDSIGLHLEARRPQPAHTADPWNLLGPVSHEGTNSMAERISGAAAR